MRQRTDRVAYRRLWGVVAAVALLGSALGTTPVSAQTVVSKADVVAFQAAGDVGGGVLDPGTEYPPTSRGDARLMRHSDAIQASIHTSGLPKGAYTVWWVVFNNPAGCFAACGEVDLLNPAAEASVFYAAGALVGANGIANFNLRHELGEPRGIPGSQDIINGGAIDPGQAEIHNIIKYHGPASDDPDTLYEQMHTILGSCEEGANAVILPDPFGLNCFDPQAVVHPLP